MRGRKFCTRRFSAKSRLTRERWNFRSSIFTQSVSSTSSQSHFWQHSTWIRVRIFSSEQTQRKNRVSNTRECTVSNLFQAWIFERSLDNFYIVCITLIIFHMEIWVGILFSTVLHGVSFQDSKLRGHPGVSRIFPGLRRQIARSAENKIMLTTLFFVWENL